MCGGKHENMWLDRYFKEQDPRPEALEDWHDALTDLQVEVFFFFILVTLVGIHVLCIDTAYNGLTDKKPCCKTAEQTRMAHWQH